MKVLLTRDQESTLWNFQQSITVDGHTYLYSPFYLRHVDGGEYERLRFDELPESVKDALLMNQGIKLPSDDRAA